MRIAIVSRSSRRVGGVEDYLSMVMPAIHRAGLDMAFWHEIDTGFAGRRALQGEADDV